MTCIRVPCINHWSGSFWNIVNGVEAQFSANFFAHAWVHVDGLKRGRTIAGVLGNHRMWQRNGSDGTDTCLAVEANVDSVLLGESSHNEEAEETTWCFIECWRIGDAPVELDQIRLGNAESGVFDLDLDSVVSLVTANRHRGSRVGEVRRVVEKLSEQVGHIGNDRTTQRCIRNLTDFDTVKVLDLGEGSAHDVLGGNRTAPLTRRAVSSEHEEALCVSTHTGCHMVEAVEALEDIGVLFVALKVGDQVQHAVV